MRAILANCKIAKMLALLVVTIISTRSVSHANFVHDFRVKDSSMGNVVDEFDPNDTTDCLSLGELDIVFRTDNNGAPNIGVVLTDPRGRRIGFDPLTKRAWQALPVAEGYIDCDDLAGTNTCRGIVRVCGPVSGTYKLEVVAQQTTAYSVNVFARSKEVLDDNSRKCQRSEVDLHHVAIGARTRNTVFLNYSRNPQEKVTAQLQHPVQAQWSNTRFQGPSDVRATKSR